MLDPTRNFAKCVVSTGYDASATTVVLSSGEGAKLPAPSTDGAFNLIWHDADTYPDPADDPNKEIVRVTARSTDTLTITRAQESTSAATHNTSGKAYHLVLALTKKMIDDIQSAVSGVTIEVPGGSVNDTNVTFTFSAQPKLIVINGSPYRQGSVIAGVVVWTWSSGTATLAFPV